jgi:hypothetical protein
MKWTTPILTIFRRILAESPFVAADVRSSFFEFGARKRIPLGRGDGLSSSSSPSKAPVNGGNELRTGAATAADEIRSGGDQRGNMVGEFFGPRTGRFSQVATKLADRVKRKTSQGWQASPHGGGLPSLKGVGMNDR